MWELRCYLCNNIFVIPGIRILLKPCLGWGNWRNPTQTRRFQMVTDRPSRGGMLRMSLSPPTNQEADMLIPMKSAGWERVFSYASWHFQQKIVEKRSFLLFRHHKVLVTFLHCIFVGYNPKNSLIYRSIITVTSGAENRNDVVLFPFLNKGFH